MENTEMDEKILEAELELLVYQFQKSVLLTGEFLLHDESINSVRDNHVDSGDSVAVEEDN